MKIRGSVGLAALIIAGSSHAEQFYISDPDELSGRMGLTQHPEREYVPGTLCPPNQYGRVFNPGTFQADKTMFHNYVHGFYEDGFRITGPRFTRDDEQLEFTILAQGPIPSCQYDQSMNSHAYLETDWHYTLHMVWTGTDGSYDREAVVTHHFRAGQWGGPPTIQGNTLLFPTLGVKPKYLPYEHSNSTEFKIEPREPYVFDFSEVLDITPASLQDTSHRTPDIASAESRSP